MKLSDVIFVLLFSILIINKSHSDSSVLKGPYLGQKPPGLTPIVFAPGIVSTDLYEAFGVFSPKLKEFYFIRGGGEYPKPTLLVFRNENGLWRKSVVSLAVGEPFISTDGSTMYLGNKYMHREGPGWSEIKSLGKPFEDIPIMRLTASASGTYFFDERDEKGTIRYSQLKDGIHEQPEPVSKEINAGKWTAHPFIAPDESYLIWDSEREEGYGGTDLYISFRKENGLWGPAINMGKHINTDLEETYGSITSDGKYLFFHRYLESGTSNIFWVDAQVIKTLRPKEL